MEKQVILLNGPSSSGKSTLAKALKAFIEEKCSERYEIVSIDDFLKMTTDDVIYEDDVFEISCSLCERVIEVLKTIPGAVIDHVITSERIFNQLIEMLNAYEIHLVQVTCPLEVLRQREEARKNRCPGSAEASYEYLFPKEGYEVTVDTYKMTTEECCMEIYRKLKEA